MLLTQGCASARVSSNIKKSPVFERNFTGFALYDPARKKYLCQSAADKYYTPASNTKILTLYSSLLHLSDSTPLLQYRISHDTTFIRGVGHPGLLHPYLPATPGTLRWLEDQPGQLILEDRTADDIFGPGWAWNDFSDYYQPERSAFPLFGNVVLIRAKPSDTVLQVSPALFTSYQRYQPDGDSVLVIMRRDYLDNRWYYNGVPAGTQGLYRELPFHTSPTLTALLLQDTLGRPINWIPDSRLNPDRWRDLQGEIVLDTLYKLMMQASDNFIAEQLLWLCAHQISGTLLTDSIIIRMQNTYLRGLSDSLQWVDGSGLSRYNLFTPRSMVEVLERIYQLRPFSWIQDIFPAGGLTGTISSWYKGPDGHPYVWAKTGSLWNKASLSGYLLTRRGRTLIFSFMHNNFTFPPVYLRLEMQTVLEKVYTSF